jgi:hypothetical protein
MKFRNESDSLKVSTANTKTVYLMVQTLSLIHTHFFMPKALIREAHAVD